ncbi:MAG: hypothetical protein HYY11_07350 [Candidatus Methylomirabilis oxyfera]|nr:hypothetical protein [Candidatus Methylomirabilis oxyfera]
MNPESLDVYCTNEKCGDIEADTGVSVPAAQSRRYRRMNYKGKRRIGAARAFLSSLVMFQFDPGLHALPPGKYHIFQCSACNRERIYREQGDQLTEV